MGKRLASPWTGARAAAERAEGSQVMNLDLGNDRVGRSEPVYNEVPSCQQTRPRAVCAERVHCNGLAWYEPSTDVENPISDVVRLTRPCGVDVLLERKRGRSSNGLGPESKDLCGRRKRYNHDHDVLPVGRRRTVLVAEWS